MSRGRPRLDRHEEAFLALEIPGFIELQQELEAEGLQFVGVSLDEEGFEVVRMFAEEMGISYPLVIGDETLAGAYGGILGLPTTFVMDRQGRIRQRFVGMVREGDAAPGAWRVAARRGAA